ncbi:MAG: hypothetical protein LJU34_03595 [Oscillospiraceae bacterium]|nr:hypothetical protein [Oscillospiraceae bacterium]
MTNNQTGRDVVEIDLLELAQVLLRRIGIIILCTVLAGGIAFGYTYNFVEPMYTASAMMYVNNSDISVGSTSISLSSTDVTVGQNLVSTYAVIAKSRTVLEEVIETEELDYSYEKLYSMITISSVEDTAIFQISVTDTSAREAEDIANTIADILPDKISDIVGGTDARVVDYAVIPSSRTSPSYTRNTAMGALIGLLLSAAVIIVRYLFDGDIHSEDYLTKTYGKIPLLAVIPDMSASSKDKYGRYGKYSQYGSYYYKKRPSGQTGAKRPLETGDKRSAGSKPETRQPARRSPASKSTDGQTIKKEADNG